VFTFIFFIAIVHSYRNGAGLRGLKMTFIKYSGGWGYDSECKRFSIINLTKVDNDEDRPSKGWRLMDNKINDWAGDYPTLKAAKQSAIEINSAA